MPELLEVMWPIVFVIGSYMTAFYFISLVIRDASIIDIGWGLGFVLISTILLSSTDEVSLLQAAVHLLVSIWGLRLAGHIFLRKLGKKGEDWRYAQWRKDWGDSYAWRSYLQIFILQGVMMLIVALPIFVASLEPADNQLSGLATTGIMIWLVGFFFEAVGDYQLYKFLKSKPKKGAIMKTGVWKYTRHPNYFGEVTQWWGLFIAVVGAPYWIVAILSPITITYLLLKVSGIPMLEKKWARNKQFQAYKKVTSPFFPLRPKPTSSKK